MMKINPSRRRVDARTFLPRRDDHYPVTVSGSQGFLVSIPLRRLAPRSPASGISKHWVGQARTTKSGSRNILRDLLQVQASEASGSLARWEHPIEMM
jgi:hypothetical protein